MSLVAVLLALATFAAAASSRPSPILRQLASDRVHRSLVKKESVSQPDPDEEDDADQNGHAHHNGDADQSGDDTTGDDTTGDDTTGDDATGDDDDDSGRE